jgi:hypothetical protein
MAQAHTYGSVPRRITAVLSITRKNISGRKATRAKQDTRKKKISCDRRELYHVLRSLPPISYSTLSFFLKKQYKC